jgi:molecular chaperone GrpE (heat shock protein)
MKLASGINTILKRLRGDYAADDTELLALRSELERLKAERDRSEQNSVAWGYREIFRESSSPLSQLLLQLHVAEMQDNTLTASDVLVHIKRVLTIFQQHGMTVLGHAGEIVAFDPNLHELASPTCHVEENTAVCVRFPGIGYQSTVIRKALVGIEENH